MISSRTLFIILVVNVIIALGSVVLNYKTYLGFKAQTKTASDLTATTAEVSPAELDSKDANGVRPTRSLSNLFAADKNKPQEFDFYTIDKIIVSVSDGDKERYFIIDLVLQAEPGTDKKRVNNVIPAVRSAVVAYLSDRTYNGIRFKPFGDLQEDLEAAILRDFSHKKIAVPFKHVLVSKLIAQ